MLNLQRTATINQTLLDGKNAQIEVDQDKKFNVQNELTFANQELNIALDRSDDQAKRIEDRDEQKRQIRQRLGDETESQPGSADLIRDSAQGRQRTEDPLGDHYLVDHETNETTRKRRRTDDGPRDDSRSSRAVWPSKAAWRITDIPNAAFDPSPVPRQVLTDLKLQILSWEMHSTKQWKNYWADPSCIKMYFTKKSSIWPTEHDTKCETCAERKFVCARVDETEEFLEIFPAAGSRLGLDASDLRYWI